MPWYINSEKNQVEFLSVIVMQDVDLIGYSMARSALPENATLLYIDIKQGKTTGCRSYYREEVNLIISPRNAET